MILDLFCDSGCFDCIFDVSMFSDFKVFVIFLGKVFSYFGLSKVDGNIVIWIDLSDLFFSLGLIVMSKCFNGILIWVWIIVVVVVLVIVGVVVVIFNKKKG